MPTETQHLEQRVAALQSDLNTKDEQIDALTFSDNDRELSRRSWFDEAQRLQAQLAERDALICDVLEAFKLEPDGSCINPGRDFIRPWAEKVAALSASAEPSATVERDERAECAICLDMGDQCLECEEAEFREWAERHFASADFRKTAAGVFIQDWMRHAFAAWQARAALERKP